MREWPALGRIAASFAVCLCVAVLVLTVAEGFAATYPLRLLQGLAAAAGAAALLGIALAAVTSRLANYTAPEDEDDFERLVVESERLAREDLAAEPDEAEFLVLDPHDPEDFDELVREALDELPDLLRTALQHVAVVVSDQGRRHGAYGLYQGDGVARDDYPDRILVFRDTLLRDFGHDPDALRHEVTRTVRHELAHHLGADELGVRELGL